MKDIDLPFAPFCCSFSCREDKIHPRRGGRWPPAASALHWAGRTAGCGRAGDGVEGNSQVRQSHVMKTYKVDFTLRLRGTILRHFLPTVMVQSAGPNPLWIGVFCVCWEIGCTPGNSRSALIRSWSGVPALWEQEMGETPKMFRTRFPVCIWNNGYRVESCGVHLRTGSSWSTRRLLVQKDNWNDCWESQHAPEDKSPTLILTF